MGRPPLADRVYRLLLLAFPARVRREFGDDMLALFREHRGAARGSRWSEARLWLAAVTDVLVHGTAERAAVLSGWRRGGERQAAPAGIRDVRRHAASFARHPARSLAEVLGVARGGLLHDLRDGVRALVRAPLATAAVIITLALGIGMNSAVFTVVNAVLLRPVPYPHADRLLMVWSTAVGQGLPISTTAPPDYRIWRSDNKVFEDLGAFWYGDFNLSGDREPERLQGARITPSLFAVLGVQPSIGRNFTPQEDQWGRHREAILSSGLWKRAFGGDPSIVGRAIRLNGASFTVVGVMPAGMPFFDNLPAVDLWVPMSFPPGDVMDTRNNHFLTVVGRLKPAATLAGAQADMERVAARLTREFPENAGMGVKVVSLREQVTGNVEAALLMPLGAVGFVLLIACANVANLLLARAVSREREFAIRAAIGAGRFRLIRLVMVESGLLAGAGAALGLLLAWCSIALMQSLLPTTLPRFNAIAFDNNVLIFTLATAVVTALAFGIVPALHASGRHVNAWLKTVSGGHTAARERTKMRKLLVASELAVSTMLLVGAGLMAESFYRLQHMDAGFARQNTLSMQIPLSGTKYPTEERALVFIGDLLERVRALPGVQTAAVATQLPMDSGTGWGKNLTVIGAPAPTSRADVPSVRFYLCTADYFRALGMRLRSGRFFDLTDRKASRPVAIVNEALARRFFGAASPVGQQIRMSLPDNLLPPPTPDDPWPWTREIVGVVADAKGANLTQEVSAAVYVPLEQWEREGWFNTLMLAIRTHTEPMALAAPVRAEVQRLDHDQPVAKIATMEELFGRSTSDSRFTTMLLGLFAGLALLMAAVGIYGVFSSAVANRRREIGVRIALGATRHDVLALVLSESLRLAVAGTLVGLAAGGLASRAIKHLLYGVSPANPLAFASVAVVLLLVALVASYLPARRATRIDPIAALRSE